MRDITPSRRNGRPGGAQLAVLAGMLIFLAGTALAASSIDIACDNRIGIDASTPMVDELDISVVDLKTRDDVDIAADPNLYGDDSDAATPILNLGPRVATIVRDVFGDADVGRDEGDEKSVREAPIAPLAGSSTQERAPAALEPDDEPVEPSGYSPLRIYRKMYRLPAAFPDRPPPACPAASGRT